MNVEGGSAIPIHITTNAPVGAPALPVYLYTQATLGDRQIESGITSVYSVSDAELANGTFKLAGNVTAIPVIDYTSVDTALPDIHPIPVYILNPTPPTPPVVVPWYLAGGVGAANCIAAYQSKDVASYAASKVNLINPGTHDLTDGAVAPAWNTNTGWSFDNSTTYLVSDISTAHIGKSTGTMIGRFANFTAYGNLCGSYQYFIDGTETDVALIPFPEINKVRVLYGASTSSSIVSGEYVTPCSSGVLCCAGIKLYFNGLYTSQNTSTWEPGIVDSLPFFIGAENDVTLGVPSILGTIPNGDILAIAFYDVELTPAQIAAITTAMQAL